VKNRTITLLIAGVLATIVMFATILSVRADEDEEEEKPVTSNVARVYRDNSGHIIIAIRPAAQKEIGITTQVLKAVARPLEVEAYGFILDPDGLARLNSQIISAQAALDAASAQYRRTSRLYAEHQNVSLRDLQLAQAAYVGDNSNLQALNQQLRDQWGGRIALMDPRTRSNFVNALIDRSEAIARVTAPGGEAVEQIPSSAEVIVLGHEQQPLNAQAVYGAPTVVPSLQGQTFLLLVATQKFQVRPGTAVSAYLPTSSSVEQGVMVPRSAVVRYEGGDWLYREIHGDRFERIQITPVQLTEAGYFVTNLTPGTRIVTIGAQTLLSQELKSHIQISD
jgi:hypothetical protein